VTQGGPGGGGSPLAAAARGRRRRRRGEAPAGGAGGMRTLLTRMLSCPPNCSRALSTSAAACCRSETSATMPLTARPCAAHSPSAVCSSSSLRAQVSTCSGDHGRPPLPVSDTTLLQGPRAPAGAAGWEAAGIRRRWRPAAAAPAGAAWRPSYVVHLRAQPRQLLDDSPADALGAARDQRGLALQPEPLRGVGRDRLHLATTARLAGRAAEQGGSAGSAIVEL
jgi:hypothetical protein